MQIAIIIDDNSMNRAVGLYIVTTETGAATL